LDTGLDLVFGRFLAGSVENWPRLLNQTFDNLKPGGWAEFQDWDTMLYSTAMPLEDFRKSELWQFHRDTIDLQESRGRNMRPGPKLENWIRERGFINVQAQKFRLPLGPWDKDKLEVKLNHNIHRECRRLTQQNVSEKSRCEEPLPDARRHIWPRYDASLRRQGYKGRG